MQTHTRKLLSTTFFVFQHRQGTPLSARDKMRFGRWRKEWKKYKLLFSICIMKTFCMEITCFLPSLCSPQKLFLYQISIRISQASGRRWKETKTAQDSTFLWKLCYLNRCLILAAVHENLQGRVCRSVMEFFWSRI